MPVYEYRCEKCGKKFEKWVISAQNAERLTCPNCGAAEVQRTVSSFATSGRGGADTSCRPSG